MDTSRRRGFSIPGSVGNGWPPNAASCWSREMLSVSRSRMSTYWPDLILSTSFCGKGSEAGDRANPVAASGTCGQLAVPRGSDVAGTCSKSSQTGVEPIPVPTVGASHPGGGLQGYSLVTRLDHRQQTVEHAVHYVLA